MPTTPAADRYASHVALDRIGLSGHKRIRESRVVLVGLGGLGCPVAQYLVSSGIGRLLMCDFDTVSESNLARQLLYTREDVGQLKTYSAQRALTKLNPDTSIKTWEERADERWITRELETADLLIDASDNYGTRLACNRAALTTQKAWIMGACVRMEGQVRLFRPSLPGSACYRCIYDEASRTLEDCQGAGIFSTVAGLIGLSMAHTALAYLAGIELPDQWHLFDGHQQTWQSLHVAKKPTCIDCSG